MRVLVRGFCRHGFRVVVREWFVVGVLGRLSCVHCFLIIVSICIQDDMFVVCVCLCVLFVAMGFGMVCGRRTWSIVMCALLFDDVCRFAFKMIF